MNRDALSLPKFAAVVVAGTALGLGASAAWAESINVTVADGEQYGMRVDPGSPAIGHDHVWMPIALATNHGRGSVEIASVTTKSHVRVIGFGFQEWPKDGKFSGPIKSWPVGGSTGPTQEVMPPQRFGRIWVGLEFPKNATRANQFVVTLRDGNQTITRTVDSEMSFEIHPFSP